MKYVIYILMLLLMIICSIVYPQENIQPITISPVIGDTLDRVEREYFDLFPDIQNFQKAFWYFDSDSLLMVNIKFLYKDELIDTTFPSALSLLYLKKRIAAILVKTLKRKKWKYLK